ncbi:helix-turn-helix transcriptional regulator [Deinococcus rubellus]|uniref:helix-turn-helix transcriptional regulator n=1 Tax=Deinococcus rubellus TaxID=1889240 RepID=UPI0031E7AB84
MAGNSVKQEREKLGLTQRQLSAAADVPVSSLQKIERHAFSPNIDHALGVAEALGQPVERIFFRDRSRIRLKKPTLEVSDASQIPARAPA